MEKVSSIRAAPVAPAPVPTSRPGTGVAAVAASTTGVRVDGSRFMARPSADIFGRDLLGLGDGFDGIGAPLGDSPVEDGSSGSVVDEGGEFQSLLEAASPADRYQDGEAPRWHEAAMPLFIADASAPSAETDRETPPAWARDDGSTEQFSIIHPVWGQLDVDSRRSSHSWDLVVRCADDGTRERLLSREAEFRRLLHREYGVTLDLDVRPSQPR